MRQTEVDGGETGRPHARTLKKRVGNFMGPVKILHRALPLEGKKAYPADRKQRQRHQKCQAVRGANPPTLAPTDESQNQERTTSAKHDQHCDRQNVLWVLSVWHQVATGTPSQVAIYTPYRRISSVFT